MLFSTWCPLFAAICDAVVRPVVQYFGLGFAKYLSSLYHGKPRSRTHEKTSSSNVKKEDEMGEEGGYWSARTDASRTTPLSEDTVASVPFECLAIDGVLSAIGTKYAHRYLSHNDHSCA